MPRSYIRTHGHGRCHGHCRATELGNPRVTGQLKKYIKSENGKKVTKIIQKGDLNHLFCVLLMNIFFVSRFFSAAFFCISKKFENNRHQSKKKNYKRAHCTQAYLEINDRTKLNTINQLAKRAKSALCKQNERKTKKKHQNIWFVYGNVRTFVSNQSEKNNLKNFSYVLSHNCPPFKSCKNRKKNRRICLSIGTRKAHIRNSVNN